MDPARWERIEALCDAALEQEPTRRAAFLDAACAGDAELSREVQSLLDAIERDPTFLERPLVDLSRFAPPEAVAEPPVPETIGPYRILRLLGRGGMGEVHLATRGLEDVQQTVALKVIQRGRDTDEVLQRFRLERRILASLDHPNIARLIDAGATPDGRPYFVMEHVEGLPINEYCDRHRFSVRDRLELFRVICSAVQHAHQNLIVHRDLKPGNILVTEAGVPKLLDFGIGKVLARTDAFGTALETRADLRVLTPEYAAPEQVSGGAVTTATDVYCLGILLYELLTGRHPYVTGHETLQEMERAVLETDPLRPSAAVSRLELRVPTQDAATAEATPERISEQRGTDPATLRRRLAGDLDNIVLKALRKDPAQRYASAAALAEDIQRHLDGLPVSARPLTMGYRARKFVGRHPASVAAASMAILALLAISTVTVVQSRRVAAESARVTRERDKLLEVRGFLMEMFGATGADQVVGDTVTARRLLDLQAARLQETYRDRPELRAEMMEVLADGYDRLGLVATAEPLAQSALALRREIHGEDHIDVASALNTYGWILHESGRPKDAEPLLSEAVRIRRAAGAPYRLDLARSLNDLGVIYNELARYDDAATVLAEALDRRLAGLGENHRSVGVTANNLASAYYFRAELDSAVRVQEVALRALRASVGTEHQRSVVALSNLAAFKSALGDHAGADQDYRELLALQTRIQGRDHPVTAQVMTSLGALLYDRAGATGDTATLAEGERLFRDALAILEARLGPNHPRVGLALHGVAWPLTERGDYTEAFRLEQRALNILRATLGDANQYTARAVARLGLLHWRTGNTDEALRLQRSALETVERLLGPDHVETARAQGVLCDLLLFRGEPREARDYCARAELAMLKAPRGQRGGLHRIRLRLAHAQYLLGERPVADSILAVVHNAVANGEGGPGLRTLLDSVTTAFASTGR